MRTKILILIAAVLLAGVQGFFLASVAQAGACLKGSGIGVERVLEIDNSLGARYGSVQFGDKLLPLKKGEVVLTFDDGPLPRVTKSILKTLASHCTKATFFSVGKMASAYPDIIRQVAKEGHTVGSHTHSHPRDLRHHYFPYSRFQIERGFNEVQKAVGQPISPFFRFPGLHDYMKMNAYLSERNIANFSVDIVPGDTNGISPSAIIRNTLSQLRRKGKGILLLHDIKPATAAALPRLLSALKRNGYKIVHLVSKKKFVSVPTAFMDLKYGHLDHRNPKTIIGGLTYHQLYKTGNKHSSKNGKYSTVGKKHIITRKGHSTTVSTYQDTSQVRYSYSQLGKGGVPYRKHKVRQSRYIVLHKKR